MQDYITIRELIQNAILNSLSDHEPNPEKISITEAIQCLRKSYLRRRTSIKAELIEESIDLVIGKAIHEYIQKCFEKCDRDDVTAKFEIKVEDEILSGRIDAVFEIDNTEYVVEFKTVKEVPQKTHKLHRLQLNAYLALYDSPIKSNTGYVVYIPKWRGQIRVYSVKFDQDDFAYVKRRAEILMNALKTNSIPHADITNSCYFCEFYSLCKDLGGVEK